MADEVSKPIARPLLTIGQLVLVASLSCCCLIFYATKLGQNDSSSSSSSIKQASQTISNQVKGSQWLLFDTAGSGSKWLGMNDQSIVGGENYRPASEQSILTRANNNYQDNDNSKQIGASEELNDDDYDSDNNQDNKSSYNPLVGGPNATITTATTTITRNGDEISSQQPNNNLVLNRSRRVAVAERRPILNEFSFPANLVQGMRFLLMCQVLDGDPPVRVKWFKDNVDLSETPNGANPDGVNDPRDQVELIGNDELGASLLFRRVLQQHSGNYTCIASNHFGTSSYSSIMSVKVPPKWRVEPQDKESIIGEQICIDCQATGSPNPFIRWKFTGGNNLSQQQYQALATNALVSESSLAAGDLQPINYQSLGFKLINSNHYVQTLENGSLSLRQTAKEHEGYYLCEADNGVEPSLVKVVRLIVHQQAQIPDDIQLVEPSATTSSQSPPDMATIPEAPGSSLTHHNPHTVTNMAPHRVTLGAGSGNSPGAGNGAKSVHGFWLMQNTTLVRLLCQPIGEHPLTIEWLKDGQVIYTHSSSQLHQLNDLSSSSLPAHLSSGQLATSSSSYRASGASSATLARFHVQTRRNPARPQVGLESELSISQLNRADASLYTCSARNVYGRAERTVRLVVQEPPEPPEMVDVAHISSRSIGLRWLAPFDGNSPIVKYTVEYRKHPDSINEANSSSFQANSNQIYGRSDKMMMPYKSVSITELSGQQSAATPQQQQQQIQHTVHDLEPLARYTMRVIAVNAAGQSRPSVALSLRTEEEVPSVVPSLVETNVLSSRTIKLRWTISYAPEREIIEGFFVGYRSLDTHQKQINLDTTQSTAMNSNDQPTFTYKTIRLTNSQQQQQQQQHQAKNQDNHHKQPELLDNIGSLNDHQQQRHLLDQSALLSPVSSVTKSVQTSNNPFTLGLIGHMQSASPANTNHVVPQTQMIVVSNFEYIIGGLDRNTEYSILIQCFNKKGAGPTSDPVVFKTFATDPPEKLILNADEITESSLKLSWRFLTSDYSMSKQQQDHIDGYVLTFAKLLSESRKSTPKMEKVAPFLTESISELPRQSLDPAARISQANPSASNDNNQVVDNWQAIQLAPQQRNHQLKNLECGSPYSLKIWAFNKVGRGEPSDVLTISTRGKAPVAPDRKSFLSINSTQVRLHLSAWYDGGCELDKFVVKYRIKHQPDGWVLVSNNILKEQGSVIIRDLLPATGYELLVTAFNQVGPTEYRYKFTTLDADGKQVPSNDAMDPDVDYATEDQSARREVWPGYSGNEPSSLRATVMLLRHMLNSPFTLLLALCLLIVLFISLLFHRFSDNSSHSTGSSTGTLTTSSSKKSCPLNGRSGGGHDHDHRMSPNGGHDLGNASIMMMDCDQSTSQMNGGSLAGTPRLNMAANIPSSVYGYAQSAITTSTGGNGSDSICRDNHVADCLPYVSNVQNGAYNSAPGESFYGTGVNNYSRSVNANQPNATIDEVNPEQQCLMQMLMMNAQQQQNDQQQSYITAALTTLARNKNKLINSPSLQHTTSSTFNPNHHSSATMNHATLSRQLVDYRRLQQQQGNEQNCNYPEQSSDKSATILEMCTKGFQWPLKDVNQSASTSGRGSASTRSSLALGGNSYACSGSHIDQSVDQAVPETSDCDKSSVEQQQQHQQQYEVPFKSLLNPLSSAVANQKIVEENPDSQPDNNNGDDLKKLVCY